jgi:hypothetical protein
VPGDRAEALAAAAPELSLRTEAAHAEAFVHLGPGGETTPAQWQLVWESLRAWGEEHRARPSGLGTRVTYLSTGPITPNSRPDCDFAVPLASQPQPAAQNRTGGSASS